MNWTPTLIFWSVPPSRCSTTPTGTELRWVYRSPRRTEEPSPCCRWVPQAPCRESARPWPWGPTMPSSSTTATSRVPMHSLLPGPWLRPSPARNVATGDGTITIHRQTNAGYDVVTSSTPAVVSVTAGVVEPRYPTFKGIMDAKKKEVTTLTTSELGVDPTTQQKVTSVAPAPSREGGLKVEDEGEAYLKIVELLEQRKVI